MESATEESGRAAPASASISGGIVVGVDGSPVSRRALRYALAEARLRRCRLQVVHAWRYEYPILDAALVAPINGDLLEEMPRAARALLDQLLDELAAESDGVELEPLVVEGAPAQVLLEAARDAELLVVGSRGHGGFAGLLLGSVSQQCAQHAPCPVTIVHAEPEERR